MSMQDRREYYRHRREDRSVLKYAGRLGHTVACVVDDDKGGRYLACECSDIGWAQTVAEKSGYRNPRFYQRVSNAWRSVP